MRMDSEKNVIHMKFRISGVKYIQLPLMIRKNIKENNC